MVLNYILVGCPWCVWPHTPSAFFGISCKAGHLLNWFIHPRTPTGLNLWDMSLRLVRQQLGKWISGNRSFLKPITVEDIVIFMIRSEIGLGKSQILVWNRLKADTHEGFCGYQWFHKCNSSSGAEFPPCNMLHNIKQVKYLGASSRGKLNKLENVPLCALVVQIDPGACSRSKTPRAYRP